MLYDEEKHSKLLKSNSLIKLKALQVYKPATKTSQLNESASEVVMTTEASDISSH